MASSSSRCVLIASVVTCLMLSFLSEGARESVMFSKVTTAPAQSLPEVQPVESAQTVAPNTQVVNAVDAHGEASESHNVDSQSTATIGDSENYAVGGLGLSDTRSLEGGKYFYDISNAERSNTRDEGLTAESGKLSDANAQTSENINGFELSSQSHANQNFNLNDLPKPETDISYNMKGQGLSDTRSMEGGKYFYDVSNAETGNTQYDTMATERNSAQNNVYGLFSGNPSERGFHASGEGQGLSDTRTMENAKYFYDISADEQLNSKNPQSYGNGYASERLTDAGSMESSKYMDDKYVDSQKEDESSSTYFQNGNSEPERYVFDTMEEYEKYMENRHYKP